MNTQLWIDHLSSWKHFLKERIAVADDIGEKIKYERQLKTIELVRYGAVLNPSLISNFIKPEEEQHQEMELVTFHLELNASQKRAVKQAMGNECLTLIQGPPGTGKTQVISEICLQLWENNPNVRILICSETHVAVNNLLSRLHAYNKQMRILRIQDKENDGSVNDYSPNKVIKDYIEWAEASIQNEDAFEIIKDGLEDTNDRSIEKALALSANVVGMTCNKVAAYEFRDSTEMFDVAIVDEVCKATLPEILSPLTISSKAILLGDPKQLPPVFCSEDQDIIRSIDNCKLDRFMYIDKLFERMPRAVVLDTQYRMTYSIGLMISDMFYDGKIVNGRDDNSPENSLTWIDYKPVHMWPYDKNTYGELILNNDDECRIIVDIVENLKETLNDENRISIISPYRAQVKLIRSKCPTSEYIKIDTVDGFQGKESEIVIFSATRTTGTYRFLSDVRRLNVALSRAKNRIIIVGDLDYCIKNALLREVAQRCEVKKF